MNMLFQRKNKNKIFLFFILIIFVGLYVTRMSESTQSTVSKVPEVGQIAQIAETQNIKHSVFDVSPSTSGDLVDVVRVIDGDTIVVYINEREEKVRLIGINTPERVDLRKLVQCFGKESSDKMKELLNNAQVFLKSDSTQDNRDKYGRLLRYVYKADGTFLNQIMVEEGYAYEYTYRFPYQYQKEFKLAQHSAQLSHLGLWADDACKI